MSGEDAQGRKRIAIIGVCSFLLVAMVVAVTVGFSLNGQKASEEPDDGKKSHVASTMKAVQILCHPTDYKKECEDGIRAEAGNITDPKQLIKIAFNITIKQISEGLKESTLLHEVEKEPRAKMALETCKHLMDLSIGEFQKSLDHFGQFDINTIDEMLMNLKVWLSGAITYQETCLNGFENTTSPAGQKMKEVLTSAMHLSSNGLAIISDFATTMENLTGRKAEAAGSQPGRRLLQDLDLEETVLGHEEVEFPAWVNEGPIRRLLTTNPSKLKLKLKPNVVVAKDGSGKYKSITKALSRIPKKNNKRYVIYIKEGVYHEYVHVTKQMKHVVMIGDGPNKTRITGHKNFIDGTNTYNTATVAIEGDSFIAINMGFENSAGAIKHQAVALRVQADYAIFYKCSMDGYQDTVYAHTLRQFYRDCTISGTIDFVFGDALAVFQNCTFVVRKPLDNQQCIVTAQGRKDRFQPSGIVIQGSSIKADPEYLPFRSKNRAYLARPWKPFSRTIIMDTRIDDFIQPDGYMPWQDVDGKPINTDTCFYSEINNSGPGSDKSKRVKWRGIKTLTAQQATFFTPLMFFKADSWIKDVKIPYYSGVKESKH